MPGSRSIARLLERHKVSLSNEILAPNVLQQLSKKGVISAEEEDSLRSEANPVLRGDLIVHLFSQKGFNAFRELCITLELECPHLQLTSLLLDSAGQTDLLLCLFYNLLLFVSLVVTPTK